jgi:hypothetical protein
MSAAMHRYVEVVKQYPGQQQVDLAVEIEVPGSWFGAGPMGALTPNERREKYTAQAVEYSGVHEFPGASRNARNTKEQAIRFICGPQLLSDYAFLHYNYKYDWLRPTLEEIVDAYTKLYGKESRESDIESDGSSEAEEVEEDGEED